MQKKLGLKAFDIKNSNAHLASRIAERQLRDKMMLSLPDRQSMINCQNNTINVSLISPFPDELNRINELIEKQDIDSIVARYPVRESSILTNLAKGLRFSSREDYERAALTRVGADKNLQSTLREKFGALTSFLQDEICSI